jgi:hypothetical protein
MYLDPHLYWDVMDVTTRCKSCDTWNLITLIGGKLANET